MEESTAAALKAALAADDTRTLQEGIKVSQSVTPLDSIDRSIDRYGTLSLHVRVHCRASIVRLFVGRYSIDHDQPTPSEHPMRTNPHVPPPHTHILSLSLFS
jgi:hypothetical protein